MRTIELRTTQNVTIEYDTATVGDRIFAYIIDALILATAHGFFTWFVTTAFKVEDDGILTFLIGFLPFFELLIYHFCMEYFNNGQSFGKKAMGLQVVRLDGSQLSAGDALLRSFFLIIDVVFSFGIIAVLLISSSDRRQRLGDMTANSTVIKIKQNLRFSLQDILKISTTEDYEPIYHDVKKLSEQDMLLIKNALSRYAEHRNHAHAQVIDELTETVRKRLDIVERPKDKIDFLRTLIRDYIVLTR